MYSLNNNKMLPLSYGILPCKYHLKYFLILVHHGNGYLDQKLQWMYVMNPR